MASILYRIADPHALLSFSRIAMIAIRVHLPLPSSSSAPCPWRRARSAAHRTVQRRDVMILTTSFTIDPKAFTPPLVGVARAGTHLEANRPLFDRFVASIPIFDAKPRDAQLAISIERDQILLMTYKPAMRKVTNAFRVAFGLKKGLSPTDVRVAMDYGVLPYLASAHLLVQSIVDLIESENLPQMGEIRPVMDAIDADSRMVYQLIADVQNRHAQAA